MGAELWVEVRAAVAADGALPSVLRARVDQELAQAHGAVHRFALRLTRDQVAADDLTQETFVVALQALGNFQGRSTLSTWLCAIARNLHLRATRKLSEVLTADGVVDAEAPEASALRSLQRHQQLEILAAAIADLPELERQAIRLRYVDELGQQEIGAQIGEDGRAALVRSRRHLGLRLRAALQANQHTSSFFDTPTDLPT